MHPCPNGECCLCQMLPFIETTKTLTFFCYKLPALQKQNAIGQASPAPFSLRSSFPKGFEVFCGWFCLDFFWGAGEVVVTSRVFLKPFRLQAQICTDPSFRVQRGDWMQRSVCPEGNTAGVSRALVICVGPWKATWRQQTGPLGI